MIQPLLLLLLNNYQYNCHNTISSGSVAAPLSSQLKERFLKFICKDLEHSSSTINQITKHACMNPMSVYGRNWCDIICKNGYVGMRVKEIYNEWYETLYNKEMDCISVLEEMIDVREGRDYVTCYILPMTYAPTSLIRYFTIFVQNE